MLFTTASFCAETITIRSDEWMPFNGQPGDKQYPGFALEIMKMIYEAKGCRIDYRLMPWNRSLIGVKNGTYDAVIGATQGEAKDFILPKEPLYILSPDTFYVLKENEWQYKGVESLRTVRLGSIADYEYSDDLTAYIKRFEETDRVKVEYGDSAHLNLIRSLLEGYVDVIIDTPSVFAWEIGRWKISSDNFKHAGASEDEKWPMYIAFSSHKKTSQIYADTFDLEIRKLRRSDRYKELLHKYMLDE